MKLEPVAWMYQERKGKPFASTVPPESQDPIQLSENEVTVTDLYAIPEGYVVVPDYRGYANLGLGMYCIYHSNKDADAELVISIASEADRAHRAIGEDRDVAPGTVIEPEEMAVRIRFATVAALDALESQLQKLRETHFTVAKEQS